MKRGRKGREEDEKNKRNGRRVVHAQDTPLFLLVPHFLLVPLFLLFLHSCLAYNLIGEQFSLLPSLPPSLPPSFPPLKTCTCMRVCVCASHTLLSPCCNICYFGWFDVYECFPRLPLYMLLLLLLPHSFPPLRQGHFLPCGLSPLLQGGKYISCFDLVLCVDYYYLLCLYVGFNRGDAFGGRSERGREGRGGREG